MSRIGERRVVAGQRVPRLYPGEVARATRVVPSDKPDTYVAVDWLIEPLPGWYGWWLRMRWRLFRWLPGGQAKLETTVEVTPEYERRET